MSILNITDPLIRQVLAVAGGPGRSAWAVGGFVRDQLLGRPVHDLDLIVPEGGIGLARAVARRFGGAFFVLDEERDVARAILDRAGQEPLNVDVARLRVPDLAGDLALRDFTINAMAAAVPAGSDGAGRTGLEVIDLFDGQADLARRLIRTVNDDAFRDDPLRTLRGVRQAVELGFWLSEATCDLIRRDGRLLSGVAAERIRDELIRIVDAPGAWQHLRLLARLDLLRPTLPEVQDLIGVTQSEPHYLDVFDHTRSVMAHAEGILALLWPEGTYQVPPLGADAALLGASAVGALPAVPEAWAEVDPSGAAVADLTLHSPAGSSLSIQTDACTEPLPADPVLFAEDGPWAMLVEVLAPFMADLRAHLLQPLAAGRTRRDLFMWASLAHDWGKPRTRSVGADWRIHFYDHDHRGADLVENRLRLLAFSANEATYAGQLVEHHMRPGHLAHRFPPSKRALYRYYRDTGSVGPDVALLSLADKIATRGPLPDLDGEFWQNQLAVVRLIFEAYFRGAEQVNPVPLLNGRQIMAELNLPPGPQIGKLIESLREAQAVGEVSTAEEAYAWLHEQVRD